MCCVFKPSPSHNPPQRQAVFKDRYPVHPNPSLMCSRQFLKLHCSGLDICVPSSLLSLSPLPEVNTKCLSNVRRPCAYPSGWTAGFHDGAPPIAFLQCALTSPSKGNKCPEHQTAQETHRPQSQGLPECLMCPCLAQQNSLFQGLESLRKPLCGFQGHTATYS